RAAPDLGLTPAGLPVELVAAPPASFGTALFRATGPAEYVASLEPLPAAGDEEELYRALRRAYLPPELRGSRLAAAPADLVETGDIRGDLHAHTVWSDGRA